MFRSLYRSIISIQIAVIVLRVPIRKRQVFSWERTYLTDNTVCIRTWANIPHERKWANIYLTDNTVCIHQFEKNVVGWKGSERWTMRHNGTLGRLQGQPSYWVSFFFLYLTYFLSRLTSGINWGMLCYHNMYVSKDRGMFSRFPEHHWVALSMIYAFYPTTVFQFGV